MRYVTNRKLAQGFGSARSGTQEHWQTVVSAVALVGLVPFFVYFFGSALGGSHADTISTFSRPFPAMVALLTFWVGLHHFKRGVTVAIEDYTRGLFCKTLLIATTCITYTAMATGIYAVIRIAM
ncbi:succinate dehydrogenase subunit D [Rhodovulum imhoffii]|uniref:Succinate dehydrogenase hydrophobic membrane anchor subunit n=1 Tax=Rhodovulum imhoffii TaxID=365340 RepID=A0A2T5BRT2_9RHOB|nr:succinate dehydrogenase, hydrophobic membrane anchor protein [Rhodovulum imhoffii]MBK5933260.1 succinate dehydrogenase, hydrophobic membrane anchor protein [Rhodovulum imhoffii]PTN01995.1 succinate dehydrogenase subunit D [Rhodovulum imhoffii]